MGAVNAERLRTALVVVILAAMAAGVGAITGRFQIYFFPGIVTILLWLVFARVAASRGVGVPLTVAVGAITGLASAAATWAIGSDLGRIAPHWDGEFYTLVGRRAGMVTWPVIGALSCWAFRSVRRPAPLALTSIGVVALAFAAEAMFTSSKD